MLSTLHFPFPFHYCLFSFTSLPMPTLSFLSHPHVHVLAFFSVSWLSILHLDWCIAWAENRTPIVSFPIPLSHSLLFSSLCALLVKLPLHCLHGILIALKNFVYRFARIHRLFSFYSFMIPSFHPIPTFLPPFFLSLHYLAVPYIWFPLFSLLHNFVLVFYPYTVCAWSIMQAQWESFTS